MVDIAGALQRGMGFAQQYGMREQEARRQRELDARQDEAYGALREEYGPMAGDPVAYGQLAGIEQRQQRFDMDVEDRDRQVQVEAAQRAAAIVDQLAANGAPPELIQNRLNAMPDAVFGGAERAAAAREMALRDPSQASAILRGMSGQAAAGPEYGQAGMYDIGGQEVYGRPVFGPDGSVADFEELPFRPADQGQFERVRVAEDPTGIYQRAPDGQLRLVGRAPQSRGGDDGEADGTTMDRRNFELMEENRQEMFEFYDNQIDRAIEQANFWSSGLLGMTEIVGGTPAANLQATLLPIVSDVAFDQLEAMRAEAAAMGQRGSGLGQVTEREIAMLQSIMGDLDNHQSPAQLRRALREAKRLRASINENLSELRRRQAGVSDAPAGQGEDDDLDALLNQYAPEG
jgi:hypothetical protein